MTDKEIIERNNEYYRKIDDNEVIGKNAFRSLSNAKLKPVLHPDSMKKRPKDFPNEYTFYRKINKENQENQNQLNENT